jgi:hypothetical protein
MDPEYCLAEQFRKMTCLEWPILEVDLLGLANPIRLLAENGLIPEMTYRELPILEDDL